MVLLKTLKKTNDMGIIDIRYNTHSKRWTAKPRFAFDAESYRNGAPSAEGNDPAGAVYNLCAKLPEDMARRLQIVCPERIYRSPEYEYMDDKCVEVDGHRPNGNEFAIRRSNYLTRKQIERMRNE